MKQECRQCTQLKAHQLRPNIIRTRTTHTLHLRIMHTLHTARNKAAHPSTCAAKLLLPGRRKYALRHTGKAFRKRSSAGRSALQGLPAGRSCTALFARCVHSATTRVQQLRASHHRLQVGSAVIIQ
jgi:hypothetical protein